MASWAEREATKGREGGTGGREDRPYKIMSLSQHSTFSYHTVGLFADVLAMYRPVFSIPFYTVEPSVEPTLQRFFL